MINRFYWCVPMCIWCMLPLRSEFQRLATQTLHYKYYAKTKQDQLRSKSLMADKSVICKNKGVW